MSGCNHQKCCCNCSGPAPCDLSGFPATLTISVSWIETDYLGGGTGWTKGGTYTLTKEAVTPSTTYPCGWRYRYYNPLSHQIMLVEVYPYVDPSGSPITLCGTTYTGYVWRMRIDADGLPVTGTVFTVYRYTTGGMPCCHWPTCRTLTTDSTGYAETSAAISGC